VRHIIAISATGLTLTIIRKATIFPVDLMRRPIGMYVCLCNGHRSQDIERTAREQKLTCARAIYDALGGPVCCGTCLNTAQDLVDDVHATSPCGLQRPAVLHDNNPAPRRLLAAE
jgi:bacterioferritin-associated ferredoxin